MNWVRNVPSGKAKPARPQAASRERVPSRVQVRQPFSAIQKINQQGHSGPLAEGAASDLARRGRGRATINCPLATGGHHSMTTRHLPDLSKNQVSATAGPTIGICRTFFSEMETPFAFHKPTISTRAIAYKAIYKSFCESKEVELLFEKLLNEKLRPDGAGQTAIHSREKEGSPRPRQQLDNSAKSLPKIIRSAAVEPP